MFMVAQDESSGELFLRVVVGGIGMYEVKRKMTMEMVDKFNRDPHQLLEFVKDMRRAG
jgi:hypothetical protein